MSGKRDINKRQICFGVRIETVKKVEKLSDLHKREKYTDEINAILEDATRDVVLTSDDYAKIAEEVKRNEAKRSKKG